MATTILHRNPHDEIIVNQALNIFEHLGDRGFPPEDTERLFRILKTFGEDVHGLGPLIDGLKFVLERRRTLLR